MLNQYVILSGSLDGQIVKILDKIFDVDSDVYLVEFKSGMIGKIHPTDIYAISNREQFNNQPEVQNIHKKDYYTTKYSVELITFAGTKVMFPLASSFIWDEDKGGWYHCMDSTIHYIADHQINYLIKNNLTI